MVNVSIALNKSVIDYTITQATRTVLMIISIVSTVLIFLPIHRATLLLS